MAWFLVVATAAIVVPVIRELTEQECVQDVLCAGTMPEAHLRPGIMFVEESRRAAAGGNELWDVPVAFDGRVPYGLDIADQKNNPIPDLQPLNFLRDGTGVIVYSLDTGLNCAELTPPFKSCSVDSDAASFDGGNGALEDAHGHGTAMALIAGTLAKNATVVGVTVLGPDGRGSLVQLLYGLHRVAQLHNAYPNVPAVVLAPLSSDILTEQQLRSDGVPHLIDQAIESLKQHNVITVVSAGNRGKEACSVTPARSASAVTVAAMLSNAKRAKFSNWGPCTDIYAAADAVARGTVFSGTSVSAAYAAGAVASMLSGTHMTAVQGSQALISNASRFRIRKSRGSPQRFIHVPRTKKAASSRTVERYKAVAIVTIGVTIAWAALVVLSKDLHTAGYIAL